MKKLYVGGLPFETTKAEMEEMFAKFNPASVSLVTDKFTGRSRGFGFVEIEDDSKADEAINELNGTEVGGRSLTVNEARPMESRGGRGGGRGSFGNRGGGFGGRRGGSGGSRGGGRFGGGNRY
jgi:cold-inducible RNA-binding protein